MQNKALTSSSKHRSLRNQLMNISLFCQTEKTSFTFTSCSTIQLPEVSIQQFLPFNFLPLPFHFSYTHLSTNFLTQANVITQFPLSYAITYLYFVLYTQPETWDNNQNVTLIIIILSSFTKLTMRMVSICNITVILTSSLSVNQFTWEGKVQLGKTREERDPHFVKLEKFYI